MTKLEYHVLGLMSGTSLDGVDIAYCTFSKNAFWDYKILKAKTFPYEEKWYSALKNAMNLDDKNLFELDMAYSKYLGRLVRYFVVEEQLKDIDFVSSHGHTVYHQPHLGSTYQIGNKQIISKSSGMKVICNYRLQDVQLGGQGAPLVPIGDSLLFNQYEYCLNLGGFANISYDQKGKRLAFDICPVNVLLNRLAFQIGLKYDNKGSVASGGTINQELLNSLNRLDYYQFKPPKSLGMEWVKKEIDPVIQGFDISVEDKLRTLVEHIAIQITKIINNKNTKVLVTGGGAYNDFLMKRLAALSPSDFIVPQPSLIEFKEALIFAFLGVLRDRNEVNCLRSVTNAERDHSSGIIWYPDF